jgi:hypothetical protein
MTVMPQLFVTVDELSLEACWSIVFMHPGGYAVLYRPGNGDGGAELSNMYHIGPTHGVAAAVIWAEYAWYKVVPFGEIETKPSDPKHVG